MARQKAPTAPKVQRGISLQADLFQAIGNVANTLGQTWNEVAEAALRRAFLHAGDLQNRAVKSNKTDTDDIASALRD